MDKIVGKATELILKLMDAPRDQLFELRAYKQKRTLTQNSYYWALVGEVAKKNKIRANEIHNTNLRDLGLVLRINDKLVPVYIPDTDDAEKTALNASEYHIKPTSEVKVGKDGVTYRCYVLLRGSSTFNTEEMGALLDLMIQQAESVGVEVMSPNEIARMRELEKSARKNKSNRDQPESTGGGRG